MVTDQPLLSAIQPPQTLKACVKVHSGCCVCFCCYFSGRISEGEEAEYGAAVGTFADPSAMCV